MIGGRSPNAKVVIVFKVHIRGTKAKPNSSPNAPQS